MDPRVVGNRERERERERERGGDPSDLSHSLSILLL